MGTFKDEAYEKLDYLSQLTEIVIAPQDEFLSQVPERIEITLEDFQRGTKDSWSFSNGVIQVSKSSILERLNPGTEYPLIRDVLDNFEFEASEDLMVDLENNSITGSVFLVKKANQIDEKKLLTLAVNNALNKLQAFGWPKSKLQERCITVLNTFEHNAGNEWARNTADGRLNNQARHAIGEMLKKVILENVWRVRDVQVISKIGDWIDSYMKDQPDTMGLVNLIKLKIMLDKDLPVYSIDEVKNGNTP